MSQRVAEQLVRAGPFRRRRRLRVDLHGVSVFGPRANHTLIRWEWVEAVDADTAGGGVVVRSPNAEIRLPPGAFGRDPAALAALLQEARSIGRRAEVIGTLADRR